MINPKTSFDVSIIHLNGDRNPIPLVNTQFGEDHGSISPDGKWLAYTSNESGTTEIYVRSFPEGIGKRQVSTDGGNSARWRADGRELFFMQQGGRTGIRPGFIYAVDVIQGPTFQIGTPKALFDSGYVSLLDSGPIFTYSVSADGQRFLVPRPSAARDPTAAAIVVVTNWIEQLKAHNSGQ